MKKHFALALGLASVFALASCGNTTKTTTTEAAPTATTTAEAPTSTTTEAAPTATTTDVAPTTTTEEEKAFSVLNAEGKAEGFTVDEATNVYTFTVAGEYTVSGKLEGSLVFASTLIEKVTLNLAGAEITSENAVIDWQSKDSKIEIKAKNGTSNSLITKANADLSNNTINSENNIEIGGKGKLYIENNQKHAVSGSDISIVSEVELEIVASVKDAIHGKSITIDGGNIKITAKDDAFQAELNKKSLKGTIIVNAATILVQEATVAFKADASIVFAKTGTVSYKATTVETNYSAPLIDIGTGDYPAAEVTTE